jgi:lipoprotein-releasing system permease protein
VAGITTTGMYEYDVKYSYIDIVEAREFFKIPLNSASAFKIKTSSANQSFGVARKLEDELGYPYATRDWTELNKNLLYAIKLQKAVIFIVLTAIVLVAAFNIMSTLVMMMSEKKREISILKAMGLKNRDAAAVFISVGAIIGVSGALGGAALGLLIGQVLKHTRFIQLPADVYFISYLPVDMQPTTLGLIMLVSVVIALMATLYPSWTVARESPVEGLRYE